MVLERIASLVAREHHAAGLYTMFDSGEPHAPATDALTHSVSRLGRLPGSLRARRWLLPFYPAAIADLSSRLARDHRAAPINLLFSTSSVAAKSLRPPQGVPHLCYCHTPARYLWSQSTEYARESALARLGLVLCGPALRSWDRRTADRVNHYLANSTSTAALIERCYGRPSTVIHPPVRTTFFTLDPSVPRGDFWLFVGALEPYKRVDLAIEGARRAGARLVIVGRGSLESRLRARAPAHVEFKGRVSLEDLRDLYRRAVLLVFPQVEDFGIAAAEALACGTPVLARRAGGAIDIVAEGVTGSYFDAPDADAIAGAAKRIPERASAACRAAAMRFAEDRFDDAIRRAINNAVATT